MADETLPADEFVREFGVVVGSLESRVGLVEPAIDGLYTRKASTVKRDAEDELFRRNAGRQMLFDRGIGIAIGGRRQRGPIQSRVMARRRCQAVKEVVAHDVDPVEIDLEF